MFSCQPSVTICVKKFKCFIFLIPIHDETVQAENLIYDETYNGKPNLTILNSTWVVAFQTYQAKYSSYSHYPKGVAKGGIFRLT